MTTTAVPIKNFLLISDLSNYLSKDHAQWLFLGHILLLFNQIKFLCTESKGLPLACNKQLTWKNHFVSHFDFICLSFAAYLLDIKIYSLNK